MLKILSFQGWKLCPVKWGMLETLMEVDLLMEDIVDGVGWFLKRKELGCVSKQFWQSMQPEWHTAHTVLDMNPDSFRVNVQTTVLAFSPKANNLDSIQKWSELLWQHAAQRVHIQPKVDKARTCQNLCSCSACCSTSGPITCHKACIMYRRHASAGVADKLSSPYLGCCVCRGMLSNWLARSMRVKIRGA